MSEGVGIQPGSFVDPLIEKRRAELETALQEGRRLKVFLLLAAMTPWPALFWTWILAAALFCSWLAFWAVGKYLNYFHVQEARRKLEDAESGAHEHRSHAR